MTTRRLAALALLAAIAFAPSANATLVAWYPFEDGGGAQSPVNRANPGTNDGTVSGPATYVGTTPNGSSWAMNFNNPGMNSSDPSGGYVNLGASATGFANFNTGITVSAWVNTATYTNWGRVIDFGNGAGVQNIVLARNGNSNNLRWEFQGTPSGTMTHDVNNVFQQNTWQHLLATVDTAGTSTVYLNGSPVGTRTGAALPANAARSSNWIGRSLWGGDQYFNGMMDDVAIWNNTLSPIDIKKLATNAITPAQTLDAKPVSYKIVAYNGDGTQAGNTTFSAYLSDLRGGVGSTGVSFASGTGTNTASAAGSVAIRAATSANPSDPGYAPDRLHIQSTLNFGTPDPTQLDPRYYLAAQLTAPPGYVFEFLSGASTMKSQYFTSLGRSVANPPGTGWTASPDSWEDQPPTGVNTNPYAVPVSSSNLAGGPWTAATQGIWARQNANNVYNNVYFDAPLRLIPGVWDAVGTPLASINTPAGISAQIARTTSNVGIADITGATGALDFRPNSGQVQHYMSEVTSISTARIQDAGYGTPDRVLAGYHASADGRALNTAVKLAGYVYIDPTWPDADPSTPGWQYVRSFAAGANDGARVWIGDTLISDTSSMVGGPITHTAVPLNFTTPGYWPITVQWFQGNGTDANMGIAVSSRDGNYTTWDSTNFKVLGDLSGTNPLQVYQRPDGIASQTASAPVQGLLGTYMSPADGPFTLKGTRLDLGTSGGGNINNQFEFPNAYTTGPWGTLVPGHGYWNGYINLPTSSNGLYSFKMDTDDNSWIYIDLNNNGQIDPGEGAPGNGVWTVRWQDVATTAGQHLIRLETRDGGGGQNSVLRWVAGGGSADAGAIIPASAFSYTMQAPGANSVGPTLGGQVILPGDLPPVVDPTQLGLRVQQVSATATASGLNAYNYFKTNPSLTAGTGGVARQNLDMTDPQNSAAGNWTGAGNDNPYPINTAIDDNNFLTRVNGVVYIPTAGNYAFSAGTDESFRLRIGNQWLGVYDGNRGVGGGSIPTGQSNVMYGYFPAAGFYPLEFYSNESTGQSAIELAHGGFGLNRIQSMFLASNNPNDPNVPAAQRFSVDWTSNAYATTPVAQMQRDSNGTGLNLKAYTNVPALGIALPPEHWQLARVTQRGSGARVPGLFGTLYDTNAAQAPDWRDDWPVIATQTYLGTAGQTFQTGGRFGFPSGPTDQIGARWTGYLNVPVGGKYSFQMDTDDRSWIFIDLDGNGIFDAGDAAPGNDAVTVMWNDVTLLPGLHKVEFRAREFGGGEWSNLQWLMPDSSGWQFIPGEYFSQNIYDGSFIADQLIAEGTGQLGGLMAGDWFNMTMPYGSTMDLHLAVDSAGLLAFFDGQFTFVPEPTTLVLLGGGLLALARRRRKTAR